MGLISQSFHSVSVILTIHILTIHILTMCHFHDSHSYNVSLVVKVFPRAFASNVAVKNLLHID